MNQSVQDSSIELKQVVNKFIESYQNCWIELRNDFKANKTYEWLTFYIEQIDFTSNRMEDPIFVFNFDNGMLSNKLKDYGYDIHSIVLGMPCVTCDDLVEINFIQNREDLLKLMLVYKSWLLDNIQTDEDILNDIWEGYSILLKNGKIALAFNPEYYKYICGNVIKHLYLRFLELEIKDKDTLLKTISTKKDT
jgi:hypothetical protein